MPGFNEEHHASAPLPPRRDAYAAFRHRGFAAFSAGNFLAVVGRQMLTAALQYELYARTSSNFILGLTGLVGALPVIFLALPAGQAADHFNRRRILMVTQWLGMLASLGLAAVSLYAQQIPGSGVLGQASHALHGLAVRLGEVGLPEYGPEVPLALGLLLLSGITRTFGWAARAPFMANLVARPQLANAVTWNSSLFEIGCIIGPALCGFFIFHLGYASVYLVDALCAVIFVAFLWHIDAPQEPARSGEEGWRTLFSGLRFVFSTKVILAVITLDLFAVLLGGATVLLPTFAQDILQVGPLGYGWLRGAQSFGAVAMAIALAHLPALQRAGRSLLLAVGGFGLATTIFGFSHSYWLSLLCLALLGACFKFSVLVRHTLVQLLTPDSMRGRVAAVNNVFIGSSNELGAFESGLVAARFGPVFSVVSGGLGTILVVLATAWKWPEIRRIGVLAEVVPAGEGGTETSPAKT